MRLLGTIAALLLVVPVLAGCLAGTDSDEPDPSAARFDYLPYEQAVWDTTGSWSMPITPPLYDRLPAVDVHVASFDGVEIHMGIHRPDIPGCPEDLFAADFPEECRTPILMDSGPYFTPSSVLELSTRPPTGIWFVPYGYTMVYMAVRGTGGSGGCMEMMSMSEQRDVDEMLTWLGEQPWSTGAIGMIGRSYDGTTPFMGAAFGNPYLKTIVPISGVPDIGDLMFSNGTSEFRGPIMHSVVYWVGFGPTAQGPETTPDHLCDEFVEGAVMGPGTALTGDQSFFGQTDYWEERRLRERVVENYEGSAWVIHGMQDWNVNPAQVVPFVNDMMDAGIKTKVWLGQWAHHYPDRNDEHENTRMDWAEMLLRWFDSELKGIDVDTGPIVEVEDHRYDWWVLDRYPPQADTLRLYLNGDNSMTRNHTGGGMGLALNPLGENVVSSVALTSEVLEGPLRLSGLVRLKLEVTPTVPTGGNVYVQLLDVYPDGRTHWLGQGWINLAYYQGGREMQTLTPGQSVVAQIQFEPLEATLSDGHRLRLVIDHEVTNSRGDSIARPEATGFIVHMDGDSFLELPVHHDFTRSPYRVG